MYLTGFADEAADSLSDQIRVTRQLGWRNIEARCVNGKFIHDMSGEEFDRMFETLQREGVMINCLGSAIANWGKQITEPFDSSLAEADVLIPRMQRMGTKLIRIMSFAVLKDRGPQDQMAQERFSRLRTLVEMFDAAGILCVHENCMNYGGMGWTYTLEILANVPGLKLVFDTGNPIGSDDVTRPEPYPKQSAWEFYKHVKQHVAYVHVKDGIWNAAIQNPEYTYPGEGDGAVREIVKDLLDSGYDGGFSMEPHMEVVFHESGVQSQAEARLATYYEYGRRFMKLIAEAGHADKLPQGADVQ